MPTSKRVFSSNTDILTGARARKGTAQMRVVIDCSSKENAQQSVANVSTNKTASNRQAMDINFNVPNYRIMNSSEAI